MPTRRPEDEEDGAHARIRAVKVRANAKNLYIETNDGNVAMMPWGVSKKLAFANEAERRDFRFIAGGVGLRWPQVDEDLLVGELLQRNY